MKAKYDKLIKILLLYGTAAFFIIFTLIRCRNITVWSDEVFSINLIKEGIGSILQGTAQDVHPPLFYLVLKVFSKIFGYQPFVYQLSAAIPFLVLILCGITVFYKKFGFQTAFCFIVMINLMPCFFVWTITIRMYMLACMFVTLCFYEGYELIRGGKKRNWILFTVCGLGAAYTHYFAFVAAGLLYLAVFIVLIYRNKKILGKCVLCGVVSLLGYLPWLYYFVKSVERVNEDYWIPEAPTMKECLAFLFGEGIFGVVIICIMLIILLLLSLKQFKKLRIKQEEKSKLSNEYVMLLIAVFVLLATILFGTVYSNLVKPIFITRYLFPIAGMLYLAIGIGLSNVNKNPIVYAVFLFYICLNCIPILMHSYEKEVNSNINTKKTIEYIKEKLDHNGILVSDIGQFNDVILDYYLPDRYHRSSDEIKWNEIRIGETVYLFSGTKVSEEYEMQLESNNMKYSFIMESSLGKYDYWLYQLEKAPHKGA